MHDVAAEGGHAGAAANEYVFHIFGVVLREEELAVRAGNGHLVTRFARKDVGRGDARRNRQHLEDALRLAAVERRRSDTDVQFDDVLLCRIGSHRVGAHGGNGVLVLDVEETVLLPVGLVDGIHIDVVEVDIILGNVDLDVLAGLELDVLALGEFHREFLDEGSHVLVGDDLAFQLLHAQGRLGNLDLEVVLDLDLAAEAPVVLDLFAGEETGLGGEDLAAAFQDADLALAAVGLSAASGGKEDALVGQGVHQVTALRDVQHLLATVDVQGNIPGRGEFGLDYQQEGNQDKRDDENGRNRAENCIYHSASSCIIR